MKEAATNCQPSDNQTGAECPPSIVEYSVVEDSIVKSSREEGIQKIYRYYESNGFGTLAQKTMQDFEYWISDFEKIGATENDAVELIIHALGIAVDRNKRNYGYANAIMKSWEQNKYLKVSDVEANDKMRQQNKQPIDQEPKMPDYSVPEEYKNQFDNLEQPDFEMPY